MFFSIIVPVYKIDYAMLRQCLDSIVGQSFKDFEAIIIDDGSPDRCGEICDEYAKSDKRLRVIHQKNGGLSVVRNVGFAEAKGTWVYIIDGDDWLEPNALSVGYEHLKSDDEKVDVAIFDSYIEFDNCQKLNYFIGREPKATVSYHGNDKQKLIDLFFPRYYHPTEKRVWADIGCTWARFYRRSFIVDNNLRNVPGLKRTQDNIFNLYVIDKVDTITYDCIRIHHYRMSSGSASRRFDPNIVSKFLSLYREYIKYANYKGTEDNYQRAYNKLIWQFTRIFANYYSNRSNKMSLRDTLSAIGKDLSIPEFAEAISKCDTRGQRTKIKVFHFLLQHKMYFTAYLISKLNEKFRK